MDDQQTGEGQAKPTVAYYISGIIHKGAAAGDPEASVTYVVRALEGGDAAGMILLDGCIKEAQKEFDLKSERRFSHGGLPCVDPLEILLDERAAMIGRNRTSEAGRFTTPGATSRYAHGDVLGELPKGTVKATPATKV
jgi:hypothetical protein